MLVETNIVLTLVIVINIVTIIVIVCFKVFKWNL